ncbi:MAG TPA: FecR domain-containing protein [Puia sp.]|jgi:ferric-dicitrate binding protein FerR (iron transport regulator)|nr:FecR domain-containing protein [Puia sp.]
MLEREFYIAGLVAAGIRRSLTADEEKELHAWIAESVQNREQFEQWRNEDLLAQKIREYYQVNSDAIYRKIDKAIVEADTVGPARQARKIRSIWPRIAAAACIILAVSTAGYFLLQRPIKEEHLAEHLQQDVLPGSNKAFLVLGNGQRISLTDAGNGTIARQGGSSIKKTADGIVVYDRSNARRQNAEQLYNTIETPRGGQYQVTLADGSKVWLNAASSLRYPPVFNGVSREVELTGEAYFEVSKDIAHPFRVRTARQTVEVLGTRFDINGYSDEKNIATTLIDGSVKVTDETGQVVIKPGEQALNKGGQIQVRQGNIDNATDWLNGDFYLNRINFRAAMRKIARWYDVEVIYDASVPEDIESGGWISRNKPLSAVLKAMERTGQVHFKVEGKKVYVGK